MASLLLLVGMAVLSAIVIAVVGSFSKTLVVQDVGAAFVAAIAMGLIGWLLPLGMVYEVLAPSFGGAAGASGVQAAWQSLGLLYAVSFVINLVIFFVVALLTPGIEVRGVSGVLVTAAALTLLEAATPYLLVTPP